MDKRPFLVDTHTHLYLAQFQEDINEVVNRALESGVERMYLPNIDSSTTADMLKLADQYPEQCFPMMGLHPCSVKENLEDELKLVEEGLSSGRYAGVGETGLDFYWDTTYKERQIEALEMQIQWAIQFDLPIILHTREAFRETLDLIVKHHRPGLRGVFHCFGEGVPQAEEVIELGSFYLGIGGVSTFKKSGLKETLSQINPEFLVLETDSPYLSPTPFRGKRNESAYIKIIAQNLADVLGWSLKEVARITSKNAMNLYHPKL